MWIQNKPDLKCENENESIWNRSDRSDRMCVRWSSILQHYSDLRRLSFVVRMLVIVCRFNWMELLWFCEHLGTKDHQLTECLNRWYIIQIQMIERSYYARNMLAMPYSNYYECQQWNLSRKINFSILWKIQLNGFCSVDIIPSRFTCDLRYGIKCIPWHRMKDSLHRS